MTDFNPPSDPSNRSTRRDPFADSTWGKAPQPSQGAHPPPGEIPPAAMWAAQPVADPPPQSVGYPRQSLAVTALGLSVLGFFCCGIPSLIGMIMGRLDINAIESGQTDAHNLSLAQAAFIVGLIAFLIWAAFIAAMLAFGIASTIGELPPTTTTPVTT